MGNKWETRDTMKTILENHANSPKTGYSRGFQRYKMPDVSPTLHWGWDIWGCFLWTLWDIYGEN